MGITLPSPSDGIPDLNRNVCRRKGKCPARPYVDHEGGCCCHGLSARESENRCADRPKEEQSNSARKTDEFAGIFHREIGHSENVKFVGLGTAVSRVHFLKKAASINSATLGSSLRIPKIVDYARPAIKYQGSR